MSVGGQTRARIEFSRIFADIFPDKKVIILTERKDLPKNASVQRHDQMYNCVVLQMKFRMRK